MDGFLALYVFMLAAFTGYEIIGRVPVILHTPLMSGSNFVHGIVLVGAARQQVVAAQPLVGTDETENFRRKRVDGCVLVFHHVAVEIGRPPHRLAGVVDDEVEAVAGGEDVMGERLDAGCVTQIEAEHLEPTRPVGEVGLGRVSGRGITRETGDDDERRPAPQQLDAGLIADLHPSAGEQRHGAREVGELAALGEVELGAPRAELVVEVMDLAVLRLAHVAVLLVDRFAVHRVGDIALFEVGGRMDIRCREHRLVAQRTDSCFREHVLVTAYPLRTAPPLEGFGANPTLLGVRAEHVACRVEQVLLLLRIQRNQQFPIGSDATQEGRRTQQLAAQILLVPVCDAEVLSAQGVRPASGRRS